MNVTSTYYSNNYEVDSYYYGDNYNYTEQYILEFGLNQQTSTITGIGYCLFSGVTLMLYTRLLTVKKILMNYAKLKNYTDFDIMHMLWILILVNFIALI